MAFRPTQSGAAQLISLKQRCVIPYPQNTVCYGIGELSIQEDDHGRPSGRSLGTSGFYITDTLSTQQSVIISGNPTGGSFRFKYPWHTVEGLFSERIPVADASAQAASEALNAMPGIQAVGGVGVRGGPLPSRPVGIFFNSPTARPHMLDAFEDPLDPFGLGGRDAITGRGGDDLICGGTGSDALHGGAGDDVEIGGRGDDLPRGAAGNDTLVDFDARKGDRR